MQPISLCPVKNATWVAKKAVPIYKTRNTHHRSFLLPRCTTHGPKIFGVWTLIKYQHALVRGGGGSRPSPPRGLHIVDSTWAQVEYILELYASRAHTLGMDRGNAYILFPHPHRVWFSSRHGAQRMSFKRYVEVGRIVLISNGESKGKIATIVEIVDQNRVRILTALGGVRP